MASNELTELEESLCQAYLVTDNKSDALRQSKYKTDGWKPETINRQAKKLFDKPKIDARVKELQAARSERTNIDADYVLKRHAEIDQLDVLDIFNDDLTALKPLNEWPKAWRTSISGLDIREMFKFANGESLDDGFLKKIKLPDKVKNLELLGRHVDVGAYSEKIDVNVHGSLADRMARARARRDTKR